jgi:hypothetical protein
MRRTWLWVALGVSTAEAASLLVAAKRWLSFVERRVDGTDRRSGVDRRLREPTGVVGAVLHATERRKGPDRRVGIDRRRRPAALEVPHRLD